MVDAVGLTSFQTIMEFHESFCESAEDRELHRSVTIEAAKDLAPCSSEAPSPDRSIGGAPMLGYNDAVPIDRTDWDYGNFRSLPELETLLRAHATVYAMLHEQVESAVLTGLNAALSH
jgi:hypothetical protein